MISRENLIKVARAGGNTLNQETPDQIGRVGIWHLFKELSLDDKITLGSPSSSFMLSITQGGGGGGLVCTPYFVSHSYIRRNCQTIL